jgi:hypothetical protein
MTANHNAWLHARLCVLLAVSIAIACGGSPTQPGDQCNADLWRHVYDPSRLKIFDACLSATGIITDEHFSEDGDADFRVALDPPYMHLLNTGNIKNLDGHLQVEAVCQGKVTRDAFAACAGFQGTLVIPPVGTHVRVTGSYVLDTNHGWMEIHPVSAIASCRFCF